MKENFEHCFALLLKTEGGFVNDPHDPGGMTNLGVTKRTWEKYVGHDVTEADMRALTPDTVSGLYFSSYWSVSGCNELHNGIDYIIFDTAVNEGPRTAVNMLQYALGVTPDGAIGPLTLDAIEKSDISTLIDTLCDRRLAFYQTRAGWPRYGNGWTNRVNSVRAEAHRMAAT
jgi:lysozyme family protein